MQVRAYWNENKRQWAVVKVGNGNRKVTFYAPELTILDGVFHTGPRSRICASGHRNRHNFVEGKLGSFSGYAQRLNQNGALACHMAEYSYLSGQDNFYSRVQRVGEREYTRVPIFCAERVELTTYGQMYVPCSTYVCGTDKWC